MKILIVSQYFYPENFRINTISRELVKRGYDVTVLTAYPQYPIGRIYDGYGFDIPYEKEWDGVKIHRVKTYPRGNNPLTLLRNCTSFVSSANKWVKKCKESFDAVFVFETSPVTVGLPAVSYKKKFGAPIYFYLQDLWPESVHEVIGIRFPPLTWVINRVVNKIYTNSDKILCTSKGVIRNLEDKGVDKEKLVYWPQFCQSPDKMEKPAVYKEDCFNIAFTGNIGDAQGLDLLVEAAKELEEENVRWYLVGDGRARERISEKVKAQGLEDKVVFMGRVSESEANAYVQHADCAYLSFQNNPLFNIIVPAKLQTYLACGAPVLAAAGGETAQLIQEAGCGIVVPAQKDELVRAVKEMLALTPQQRQEMGQKAQEYSKTHFDQETLLAQLEEMIFPKIK